VKKEIFEKATTPTVFSSSLSCVPHPEYIAVVMGNVLSGAGEKVASAMAEKQQEAMKAQREAQKEARTSLRLFILILCAFYNGEMEIR